MKQRIISPSVGNGFIRSALGKKMNVPSMGTGFFRSALGTEGKHRNDTLFPKADRMNPFPTIIVLIILFLLLSCQPKQKNTILRIGYTNYSIDQAVAFVLKGILDQQPNLIVELYKIPEDSLMFKALREDDLDIAVSVWLPLTHKEYIDKYPYEIVTFSPLCDSIGLYMIVPSYSTLIKIEELRTVAPLLKNTILIPENQNAIYEFGKDVIRDYNLTNYQLQETTWDNILAYIDESINNSSGFAFIGLRPHWIFQKYEIKTLEDTRFSFGIYEQAHILTNAKFYERMPTIAGFLEQVQFTLNDIEYIMELNQTLGSEPYENALKWINQNTFKINRWLIEH